MKQLVYLSCVPLMQMVEIADLELLVKIACNLTLAGLAILTYLHKNKHKHKDQDKPGDKHEDKN